MNHINDDIKNMLAATIFAVSNAQKICFPAFALSLAVLPITVQASSAQTYVMDTYGGTALLPVVRQQLNSSADGGSVSTYQDKLVLRTTPRNYQMIQQLLTQIDRQPQALTVAVRVGSSSSVQDNIRQGQVIITNRGIQGSDVWNQSRSQKQGSSLYQVQTLSGSAASISTGTLYSLTQNYRANMYPSYNQSSRQIIIQNQVLLPTTQGIAVKPRLLPDGQVEVILSQVEEQLVKSNSPYNQIASANHTIQGQSMNSTIIVPRGQWVKIGEISQHSMSSGSRTMSRDNSVPIELLVQ